jgi:hypothetical protein
MTGVLVGAALEAYREEGEGDHVVPLQMRLVETRIEDRFEGPLRVVRDVKDV